MAVLRKVEMQPVSVTDASKSLRLITPVLRTYPPKMAMSELTAIAARCRPSSDLNVVPCESQNTDKIAEILSWIWQRWVSRSRPPRTRVRCRASRSSSRTANRWSQSGCFARRPWQSQRSGVTPRWAASFTWHYWLRSVNRSPIDRWASIG